MLRVYEYLAHHFAHLMKKRMRHWKKHFNLENALRDCPHGFVDQFDIRDHALCKATTTCS